jgi:MFS family permease
VSEARRARLVVLYVFAANGALFGSWAPRIPEIKADLGMSSAVLGVVLLAIAVGSLVAMPLVGAMLPRYGSARMTRAMYVGFCVLFALIPVAGGPVALAAILLVAGTVMGGLDVSMNSAAVTVERRYGRSVMSAFHAAFSLGALVGAGVGSAGAGLGVPLGWQFPVFAALLLAVGLPLTWQLLPDPLPDPGEEPTPAFARPTKAMLGLGAASFAVLLAEGATADWSAVYLREDLGSSPALAGLAFGCFSATMTIGRLAGDRALTRYGRLAVVRALCLLAAVGLGIGLATGTVAGGVAGFAVLGIGLSVAFPAMVSEAGDGQAHPGPAIAAVTTCGYTGFLVGPPAIGALAEAVGLPVALGLLPVLTGVAALVVSRTVRRPAPARPGAR